MEFALREVLTKQDESRFGGDNVDQMIELAERIRQAHGGELDESAIQAVAEATGAPVDYVRLAIKLRVEKEKKSFVSAIRSQFFTLEPHTRRYVVSGLIASGCALLNDVERKIDEGGFHGSTYGILGMLALVLAATGLYNIAIARDTRQAAITGAIFGGGYYLMRSVFGLVLSLRMSADPGLLVPMALMGAVCGVAINKIVDRNRDRLGLRDPVQDRQDLLRQLHDLRQKLHAGEQPLAFLSVDIVGSTRLKQQADPLAVEYTFNEYHLFVERVTERHGGRVHSTAGDGVTCAFETPQQAFAAAKNLQTEILELNTYCNKLGSPIQLRCGIHSGRVVAPDAADVTSLSFADVIDIAAHLQKIAPAGGIVVSEATAVKLPGGPTAVGEERVEALDVRGVVWTPKSVRASGSLANNFPLPEQA